MPGYVGTPTTLPTTAAPYDSGTQVTEKADNVTGIVFSDTAGNLNIDQSLNGTNWDVTDTIAVAAGIGQKVNIGLLAPYWRARYAPTANPAVFRLGLRRSSAGYRG